MGRNWGDLGGMGGHMRVGGVGSSTYIGGKGAYAGHHTLMCIRAIFSLYWTLHAGALEFGHHSLNHAGCNGLHRPPPHMC